MANTDVAFGPGGVIRHEAPTIYMGRHWADAWAVDDTLSVTDVAWSCAPTMPVANLTFHYGRVRWFGENAWTEREKLTGMARRYVKIVVPMEDDGTGALNTKTWHGVVSVTIDQLDGATFEDLGGGKWDSVASGVQQVMAYGLESLLNTNVITGSVFEFEGSTATTAELIPFNRHGRGNRSSVKYSGAYVFADELVGAPNWSTKDIIEYLLRYASPKDSTDTIQIVYELASTAWLPDWDNPQLSVEGQSVYSVVQRLASRQRLLSTWFELNEGSGKIELHTDTLTPAVVNLSIPGAVNASIPENSNPLRIICDEDQATTLSVKDTELPVYDVIVTLGGPVICVGTFSVPDATLENNWTATEQTAYETGATTDAGYAALSLKLKQKANAAKRSAPQVDKVLSYFQIPRTWNQAVKNGEGGAANYLFAGLAGGRVKVYWPTMFVDSNLPLLFGATYTGNAIAGNATLETADMRERYPPLVFFKDPQDSRWIRAEDIGNAADLEIETAAAFGAFTLHVHVPPESHGFVVRVAGAPQHAIAYGQFTALPVDPDAGQWSYSTGMVATLAIPSGERLYGVWPATPPADKDAVRYYRLDVGDNMEAVYVAPNAVLGVKADGTLDRSNGGWIARPANAAEHLTALAKIAAAWYCIPHYVVTLETQRLTTEIGLGDLVARIGDERGGNKHQLDTNAPVTEIRVAWPLSEGDRPAPPIMTVQTFAGELDPIQVQPRIAAKAVGSLNNPVAVPHINAGDTGSTGSTFGAGKRGGVTGFF